MPKKITEQIEISSEIQERALELENIFDFKEAIEGSLDQSTSQITQLILSGAINLRASDIHIEPLDQQAKVRLRIDGMLHDILDFDRKIYENLLSRIKLLSGIKLNITERPQDGRFTIVLPQNLVEVRTSTLPAEEGESIVLRLLNPETLKNIEQLGLRKDLLPVVKSQIKRANGMVIVTGPTGCGKTTTLYAFLRRIKHPEIKIISIEDPIEYHVEGISQTQVEPKKGYDFATGLQSIMRHDPDVILLGEIRDKATAQTAIQAALTGHLVFTTVHTNDAAGTVARLTSLGAKVRNIAPALNLAMAQRLVRRVCQECVEFKKLCSSLKNKIKSQLENLPSDLEIPDLDQVKIPQAKGCPACNKTGYRGRIGIFECFLIDSKMEQFILKEPSISALGEFAQKQGMVSLRQDGLIKVLQGITTIEEVERVAG